MRRRKWIYRSGETYYSIEEDRLVRWEKSSDGYRYTKRFANGLPFDAIIVSEVPPGLASYLEHPLRRPQPNRSAVGQ